MSLPIQKVAACVDEMNEDAKRRRANSVDAPECLSSQQRADPAFALVSLSRALSHAHRRPAIPRQTLLFKARASGSERVNSVGLSSMRTRVYLIRRLMKGFAHCSRSNFTLLVAMFASLAAIQGELPAPSPRAHTVYQNRIAGEAHSVGLGTSQR